MSDYKSTEHHPFTSLLQLLLFVLGGIVLFTSISFFIAIAIYGSNSLAELRESGNSSATIGFLKIVQTGYTLGGFVVSALIFARMQKGGMASYLNLNRPTPVTLALISICLMLSAMPFIEWTIDVNKQMHLPGFMAWLENWMREKEDQATAITKEILIMTSVPAFLVNLLMIAVLPALGEEFIFRGCLQPIFTRWTRNYHWGIWIAAIIFSAIHLQFYGFLPRMLLGALFGYLYVWGKSLWLPVIAHFVNNAATVVMAYQYQLSGKTLDKLDDATPSGWPAYLSSAVMTIFLLGIVFRYYKRSGETTQILRTE